MIRPVGVVMVIVSEPLPARSAQLRSAPCTASLNSSTEYVQALESAALVLGTTTPVDQHGHLYLPGPRRPLPAVSEHALHDVVCFVGNDPLQHLGDANPRDEGVAELPPV